ncbi:phosphatidylserine decarboxylase [Helicobacter sp. 23-1048]
MNTNIHIIARQGWIGAVVLGVLFLLGVYVGCEIGSFVLFVALVVWLFIFRNPERIGRFDEGQFVAPIDGIVRDVEVQDNATCLTIQVRFFDVGAIRAPLDITNGKISTKNGLTLFLNAKAKKSLLNKYFALSFGTKSEEYKMEFFPELFSDCGIFAHSNLSVGDRCGFMKMGVVKIYLPKKYELKVGISDTITAFESVLGVK